MKILVFTSEPDADSFLATCNTNAEFDPNGTTKTICSVIKHQTEEKWWFYKDDLYNKDYAGKGVDKNISEVNKEIAQGSCEQLERTHQQLINEGYLPEPTPPA
jgi:hypothetical protein